jgi:hypothetical protein
MQALMRRLVLIACCAWIATGCAGTGSGSSGGPVYYGTGWYHGHDVYYDIDDDDIDVPDRSERAERRQSTPSVSSSTPSIPSTPRAGGGGGRGGGGRGGGGRRR